MSLMIHPDLSLTTLECKNLYPIRLSHIKTNSTVPLEQKNYYDGLKRAD